MLHHLGPKGSYSEIAAAIFDPSSERVPQAGFRAVFEAVEADQTTLGIIPIENRIEGVVRENLEFLYSTQARLCAELLLPIDHCLATQTQATQIKQIVSHPQALAQCSDFLQANFAGVPLIPTTSTSAALDLISQQNDIAAVGPLSAALTRGLTILNKNIGNHAENLTRFWVIRKGLQVLPEHDKFSIAFHFAADQPGTLHQALGYFSNRGINLHSIHSRPLPGSLWNYVFHLDATGNLESSEVREAIAELKLVTAVVVIIGSCQAASPSESQGE